MLILWIRKSQPDERTRQPKNTGESFRKHDEEMKGFRLSHPQIEATNPKDIITTDGNILAPIQNVRLTNYSQN